MRGVVFFLMMVALVGCEPRGSFPLTSEKIMEWAKAAPGEIFLVQGERQGMFRDGPTAAGNVNSAGSLRVETKYGGPWVATWPATPGYYYEASSYISELGDCLFVVRKIKAR